jgi:hypothetical protein
VGKEAIRHNESIVRERIYLDKGDIGGLAGAFFRLDPCLGAPGTVGALLGGP